MWLTKTHGTPPGPLVRLQTGVGRPVCSERSTGARGLLDRCGVEPVGQVAALVDNSREVRAERAAAVAKLQHALSGEIVGEKLEITTGERKRGRSAVVSFRQACVKCEGHAAGRGARARSRACRQVWAGGQAVYAREAGGRSGGRPGAREPLVPVRGQGAWPDRDAVVGRYVGSGWVLDEAKLSKAAR